MTADEPLFQLEGHRSGSTFDAEFDHDRLNRQARDVWLVMADHKWHTLADLELRTRHPQASISARLRDLRKPRFGSHTVERRRAGFGTGTWEYRIP